MQIRYIRGRSQDDNANLENAGKVSLSLCYCHFFRFVSLSFSLSFSLSLFFYRCFSFCIGDETRECYICFGLSRPFNFFCFSCLKKIHMFLSRLEVATEAMENIRTVQSLTLEKDVVIRFCSHLDGPLKTNIRRAIIQVSF